MNIISVFLLFFAHRGFSMNSFHKLKHKRLNNCGFNLKQSVKFLWPISVELAIQVRY